jgi:hypothetical protein
MVTSATTGEVIANAVRAPAGSRNDNEALVVIFEPTKLAPATGNFIVNTGTSAQSIVTSCSGSTAGACWKAVDGLIEFTCDDGGNGCEG